MGVVGGGISGIFSAYYLAREGADVTLFERGEVGEGSIHAAGILEPNRMDLTTTPSYLKEVSSRVLNHSVHVRQVDRGWFLSYLSCLGKCIGERTNRILKDMGLFSLREYARLAEEEDDFEFRVSGLTVLYSRKDSLLNALEGEKRGGFGFKYFTVEREGFAGGIHYPEIPVLNTELFAKRMTKELVNLGVNVVRRGVCYVGLEGLIESAPKIMTYDELVVATGIETRNLGIPVTASKGYGVRIANSARMNEDPALILNDSGVAVVPLHSWTKVTGGIDFDFSDTFDTLFLRIKEAEKAGVKISENSMLGAKLGFRPLSPNGLPIVGKKAHSTFLTGSFRLGWSYAPSLGRYAAYLALGKEVNDPAMSFFVKSAHSGNLGVC